MRRTFCSFVFVMAMMTLACGCGSGNRSVAKVATPEEAQAAREKDAQEMLKMMNKRNGGQSTTKR